jgi:NAD+ kinase
VLSRTLALNDAVVTAGPPYRMVSIAIRIDGHDGPTVTGDGLIVSTAIGSTAYNASAGGPIISPEVPAMAITAIAPHTLSFRPVVVNLSSTVELTMVRANDGSEATMGAMAELASVATGTALVLDGQVPVRLRTGDKVIIRQHAKPARFVRNPGRSYWQTLLTKMRWAAPPAIRTR